MRLNATPSKTITDYFSIPVYRNILDMLNTFDLVLGKYANAVNNTIIRMPINNVPAIGHAAKVIGKLPVPWHISATYTNNLLKAVGLPKIPMHSFYVQKRYGSYGDEEASMQQRDLAAHNAKTGSLHRRPLTNANELVNLSRNLEHEFNRVRLPIPHNFRQLVNKLQLSNSLINLWENLNAIAQLKAATHIMRGAVRTEIDAANLATKVQEETLRLENEALITREEAAAQAEEKLVTLNTEREERLNTELENASNLRLEVETLKAELVAALQTIQDTAAETGETEETQADAAAITNKIVEADNITNDLNAYENTVITATNNADVAVIPEVRETIDNNIRTLEAGVPNSDKKPANILPIAMAVAAGVMLT